MDSQLTGLAGKYSVVYTRYADDLFLSGVPNVLADVSGSRDNCGLAKDTGRIENQRCEDTAFVKAWYEKSYLESFSEVTESHM